jgi:hypothetical protein
VSGHQSIIADKGKNMHKLPEARESWTGSRTLFTYVMLGGKAVLKSSDSFGWLWEMCEGLKMGEK